MRYYVLCSSDHSEIAPHIVAEVAHDLSAQEDARELSLAANVAGPRAVIATRSELLADAAGRTALKAWEDGDDTEYELDGLASVEQSEPEPVRLRLVRDSDDEGTNSR